MGAIDMTSPKFGRPKLTTEPKEFKNFVTVYDINYSMAPTPRSASSTTSDKRLEEICRVLLSAVGSFGTVHGCTIDEAKREFKKLGNKSLEYYAQEFGYYPSKDGLFFMLADMKDWIRLAHDSTNDDSYDTIENEIRVWPVDRPEVKHMLNLIDNTRSNYFRKFCNNCDKQGHTSGSCPKLNNNNGNNNSTIWCDKCGKSGHSLRNCTLPNGGSIRCYSCEEIGHVKRECPKARQQVWLNNQRRKTSSEYSTAPTNEPPSKRRAATGVVCAVEDHQCFVYPWKRDFPVEPVLVYTNGGKRVALGQWIDFVAEEKDDGNFEIIEYRETNQLFHTLRCKSTIMVRCSVKVPADVLSNPEQPMHSSISKQVFCEEISILNELQGKEIQAVLRYKYNASDAYGYWNLECVVPE